ncbi:hypothetical protein [Desulfomonile tiedjei]|nr:hypothetical protein [Desulfomonile tiedjei]
MNRIVCEAVERLDRCGSSWSRYPTSVLTRTRTPHPLVVKLY